METVRMGRWRGFLDSLDTGGGHIFTLFLLLVLGVGFFRFDNTAGGQIITLAFGALLVLLKDRGTNRDLMTVPVVPAMPAAPEPPMPPMSPAVVVLPAPVAPVSTNSHA